MESEKEEKPTSLTEPAVSPTSGCCCFLPSCLCSTVATVTTPDEGVSWEQQVWILDLLPALIIRSVDQVLGALCQRKLLIKGRDSGAKHSK